MAKPIVKWAGGKTRLLKHLVPHLQDRRIRVYAEPFAGGAALFFKIATMPEVRFESAILADKNPELVATYNAVKTNVEGVLAALKDYADDPDRKERYYKTRADPTAHMSDVERAARLIFLNRTGYNGLWRVNSSGKFNVPYGRYKNPRIIDEDRLRAASEALSRADVRHADFSDVAGGLRKTDFVYFDPPYVPVSKTAAFTAYASEGFVWKDQERLARILVRLKERGVRALLSNACTAETKLLYGGLNLEFDIVQARRAINSDATKRGDVAELLVRNW